MLQTDRLRIRPFRVSDAPFILALLNTPGWLQYIGDRGVTDLPSAKQYLTERLIPPYQQHGFGFYACLTADGQPIGMCGFAQRDYLDYPDLGFAFLPPYIGQGYGTEAATALLAYAQSTLLLQQIAAFTSMDNAASIHLLEKLGFQFQHTFTIPGEGEELRLFTFSF